MPKTSRNSPRTNAPGRNASGTNAPGTNIRTTNLSGTGAADTTARAARISGTNEPSVPQTTGPTAHVVSVSGPQPSVEDFRNPEPVPNPVPLDAPREGIPPLTQSPAQLAQAVAALRAGTGPFAIDAERAMGIRYTARAYLVQIRRAGAGSFLFDPVGNETRFGPLAQVLTTDEWILHAADQDLPCLRELGLACPKLFDTEIAGMILGFERLSLQWMVETLLGFRLAKEYANSDWSQRPLSADLRSYAALDVELLIPLRERLLEMLDDAGRTEWCAQESEHVRTAPPKKPSPDPWRKITKSANINDPRTLAIARELWRAREEIARQADIAPGRVLANKALGALAARRPRSLADVRNAPMLRRGSKKKYAAKLWEGVARAWKLSESELPPKRLPQSSSFPTSPGNWNRHNEHAAERWVLVRDAVRGRAAELGIRQDVLLKPATQKALAWYGWKKRGLENELADLGARPWQIAQAAPAIAAAFS